MEYNNIYRFHLVPEDRHQELEHMRMELKRRELELKRREESLEQREQFVSVRAKTLDQWETCLTERRTCLEEREKQDRSQAIAQLTDIHDEADAVYEQIQNAVQAIRGLGRSLVAAQNICTGNFFIPGMKQLCKISVEMHRSAAKNQDPVIAYYANEVDYALRQLGCTPIVPAVDRPIDRFQAVPLDAGQRGNIVAQVREIGWKFDDTVLKKAVVSVKEN